MSIGKTLCRVGVGLSVAAVVGLTGCFESEENNPVGGGGGGNNTYNNDPVTINGLTWTKNININTPDSWCYRNRASYCAKYGRLYTYEAAKSACASMGDGWRLPDTADWNKLVNYAGGEDVAGKKLKSKTGWPRNTGTDDYGFSALPGGARSSVGSFGTVGYYGLWWSATEYGTGNAYERSMDYDYDSMGENHSYRSNGYSVRCVATAQ